LSHLTPILVDVLIYRKFCVEALAIEEKESELNTETVHDVTSMLALDLQALCLLIPDKAQIKNLISSKCLFRLLKLNSATRLILKAVVSDAYVQKPSSTTPNATDLIPSNEKPAAINESLASNESNAFPGVRGKPGWSKEADDVLLDWVKTPRNTKLTQEAIFKELRRTRLDLYEKFSWKILLERHKTIEKFLAAQAAAAAAAAAKKTTSTPQKATDGDSKKAASTPHDVTDRDSKGSNGKPKKGKPKKGKPKRSEEEKLQKAEKKVRRRAARAARKEERAMLKRAAKKEERAERKRKRHESDE
jgi:hypothetical protein